MLYINNLNKHYGEKQVLDQVSFQVSPGEKVGLIGVNGSGKTTLLKVIHGEIEGDSGSIVIDPGARVARMTQEVTITPGNTVFEELRSALPDLNKMENRLHFLEEEMTRWAENPDRMEELIIEYSNLHEKFLHQGGGEVSWKIDKIIQGLGFNLEDKEREVSVFSGGWQMRIELAKLLLKNVDVLLLDEPTNHLDLKATEWLEGYLKTYPGAVIIVSHDRYFLNRVTTRTLYLRQGQIRVYPGNYSFFVNAREKERELQEKAFKNQQQKLKKDLRFIERFRYKATLASRVQSRVKQLEKMDIVEAPERDLKTVNFSFNHDERELSVVYKFADLEKEYPDKTVSFQGQAEIQDRERVAIVGENGCGKTTLLRILSQQDRQYRGKLKVHPNARIKYFEQNQAESLDPHNTVIEELRHYAPPDLSDNRLRTLLGCFLFHGDDVYKQVSILSGGEKARLALAQMVCSTSNVLLLDEPTNHLDFESREVLAEALNGYQGTILVVSHDRYFINQVCSRVMEMEDGVLKNYPGSYDYYKNKKEEEKKEANLQPNEQKSSRVYLKPSRNVKAGQSVNKKELLEKSFLMEAEISRKEARLNELETDMEKPENMGEPEKLQELVDEYSNLQKEIETKMENWAELAQLLEDMD